jgi:hypothetical protein
LLNLRRGCLGGWPTTGIAPLISSTPCRRIRRRCFIRDQFVRPAMTRPSQQSRHPMSETGGFALAPQRCRVYGRHQHRRGCRTGGKRKARVVPRNLARKGGRRSNEAIIRPRFAIWYKLGATQCGGDGRKVL